MKVLFVSSGNRGISPIVHNQGDSLVSQGEVVEYFPIIGKGFIGYLSNIRKLRQFLRENKFDIIHAHYSFSAFVASLALARPLVVSLMGSDVKSGVLFRLVIRLFAWLFSWKTIIVKSEDMKESLKIKNVIIIPNGVDLERFYPQNPKKCQEALGWRSGKKHILFPANITRKEKNYPLLSQAIKVLNHPDLDIHWFNNVPNEETPLWYNGADVVAMTSLWEGSPNAIKEAMACNRPIISTKVGNVERLFGHTEGCFLIDYSIYDCADKIREALSFKGELRSRERIIELGLSKDVVARHLISIYEQAS